MGAFVWNHSTHQHIMKAFALVALIPLVAARPDVAFTAFTNFGGATHGVHHAAPHHAGHHAAYAYEAPKHNCSVQDVVEAAEVCTPAFETVCAPVELPIKKIIDVEQCYDVTRTVCSESIEV